MRFDSKEFKTVRTLVDSIIGKGAIVRVFGSRLNDFERGGDLDLLLKATVPCIDQLSRLEHLGFIKSVEQWIEWRELRNDLVLTQTSHFPF